MRRPLILPMELSPGRPWKLADGTAATTDDVFAMFVAAHEGDIASVKRLAARVTGLAAVEYNYTPPIHFAVREGHRESILAGPAREGRHDVIALLMRLGVRVPPVSKWAPYYYFKHEATAAFLLERGMDPNHMNWHRFTLLHHMAAEGELGKARLLLDHGAHIDAIDDEYRSTPLGVAARRGQTATVELLLDRGADPVAAGAPWAVPLAWAERKGHQRIADMLR